MQVTICQTVERNEQKCWDDASPIHYENALGLFTMERQTRTKKLRTVLNQTSGIFFFVLMSCMHGCQVIQFTLLSSTSVQLHNKRIIVGMPFAMEAAQKKKMPGVLPSIIWGDFQPTFDPHLPGKPTKRFSRVGRFIVFSNGNMKCTVTSQTL